MKLKIELIPSGSWGSSLCQMLGKTKHWKNIKKAIFEKEGRKCFVCGNDESKRYEAHEFWEYDIKNKKQTLEGIHHLCPDCHKVKHFALWTSIPQFIKILKKEGKDKDYLIKHFCKVNQCDKTDFINHWNKVSKIYEKLNQIEFEIDLKEYNKFFKL